MKPHNKGTDPYVLQNRLGICTSAGGLASARDCTNEPSTYSACAREINKHQWTGVSRITNPLYPHTQRKHRQATDESLNSTSETNLKN